MCSNLLISRSGQHYYTARCDIQCNCDKRSFKCKLLLLNKGNINNEENIATIYPT
mgnify:FL=1|jgi:hypothetical protein